LLLPPSYRFVVLIIIIFFTGMLNPQKNVLHRRLTLSVRFDDEYAAEFVNLRLKQYLPTKFGNYCWHEVTPYTHNIIRYEPITFVLSI